jgi:glycosyltransferase involved in cell wall biosynthesis
MHVMHILKHSNHGHGNAHVAIDLACLQSRQGHQVSYASAGGDYDGLLRREGVSLVTVEQSRDNKPSLLRATAQLIGACRRDRPDVLHAHMMAGAVIGYAASRSLGIPLVTTVHNSFDRHSALMRLADTVVAVSEAEKTALLKKGFRTERTTVVINGPNGSPREEFLPEGASISLARPSISTLCGLHRRKGVFDILAAMSLLPTSMRNWQLNIIGDGPDRVELEALLEQTDIFILASYAEPCSLALAEARHAGCALIATAVGGSAELLEHGNAGILVAPGQPVEIANALMQMAQSPQTLEGWRARSKAGSQYLNAGRVARDYLAVYEALANRRRFARGQPGLGAPS